MKLRRTTVSADKSGAVARFDPVGALWRSLRRPWLLLVLGILTLLLILIALTVPQVPPEISHDGPAVNRWLLGVSADYGVFGQVMQSLGLFDVLHSFLLRVLFGLIGLVIAVHLADLVAAALHFRRLLSYLDEPTTNVEEPLLHASPNPLYRMRNASDDEVGVTVEKVETHLRRTFPIITRKQFALATPVAALERVEEPLEQIIQERLLARRGQLATLLRPLLMLGLLMALIPVWMITTFGWELYPPPLAPDSKISYEQQDLQLHYEVVGRDAESESDSPLERRLNIRIGDESSSLPLNAAVNLRLNQVDIHANSGPPGLLIRTFSGAESLVLPGQSQLAQQVGLVFPGIGNEETILMPLQFSALRIVRSDEETGPVYLLQVLNRDEDAVGEPLRIDGFKSTVVELETLAQTLLFEPVPSLIVEARYLPGAWLLFVALALVLVGAFSYWMRTGYLLLQIAPWSSNRSITIGQSDARAELDAVKQVVAAG